MRIVYLGHSTFNIVSGSFNGIIDPYITGNPLCKCTIDDLSPITDIFITHGHSDHIGDSFDIALKQGATIHCNPEIGYYIASLKTNIKYQPFYFGSFLEYDFGRVKMVPAVHGSSIKVDGLPIYGGLACGFLFEINGVHIYHAGDTAYFPDMESLREEKIDIAMLPVGGRYTMDMDEAAKATKIIQPKIVIPMHYNTFPAISIDINQFIKKINGFTEVKVLNIGEKISV